MFIALRRTLALLVLPAAVAALAGSAHAATVQPLSGATTQGIIMRDGGVCDPIRHMGC
jgi:hypothetical protein